MAEVRPSLCPSPFSIYPKTLCAMRCARGEVINEIRPAAGHANRNECPHMFKKSGVYPKLIYVTHNVINEERKNDIITVNKIRCFILNTSKMLMIDDKYYIL